MPARLTALFTAIKGAVPDNVRTPVAVWAALVLTTIPLAFLHYTLAGKLTGELLALAGLVAAVGLIALLGGGRE